MMDLVHEAMSYRLDDVQRTHIKASTHLYHEMVLAQVENPSPNYTVG